MAYNKLPLSEKLLSKAKPEGDCLVWFGQKCPHGYGRLRVNGRLQRAHRLMYELHHGPIPEGMVVIHACDNRACVQIAHLSIGPQVENVRDMHDKGRNVEVRGADNPKSKLTEAQVSEIRRRYKPYSRTDGTGQLARDFGITEQSVHAIVRRKAWKHVA